MVVAANVYEGAITKSVFFIFIARSARYKPTLPEVKATQYFAEEIFATFFSNLFINLPYVDISLFLMQLKIYFLSSLKIFGSMILIFSSKYQFIVFFKPSLNLINFFF